MLSDEGLSACTSAMGSNTAGYFLIDTASHIISNYGHKKVSQPPPSERSTVQSTSAEFA